jgi:hypothetical protein
MKERVLAYLTEKKLQESARMLAAQADLFSALMKIRDKYKLSAIQLATLTVGRGLQIVEQLSQQNAAVSVHADYDLLER